MRTKQAMLNAIFSVLLQLALAISGIIVPRFFTAVFGSAVNGLASSISQFITYMSLVEAGIGAAATVSLYRPLADKSVDEVNGILSATKKFYLRSGLLFAGLLVLLFALYPLLINNEIPAGFAVFGSTNAFIRMMILVLSVNGLVDYFFLGKYRVLLMADQRGYILYGIQIIGTVIMTVVSILQIKMGMSALLVKSTAAIIYILRSAAAILYCRKKYPLYHFKSTPNTGAFNQRNAALIHQIVNIIANNAATILLTVMVRKDALAEVSVYAIFNLVAYSFSNLFHALTNGLTPSFGQVIAKDEKEALKRSFNSYEFLLFMFVFICYICMAALLFPFIKLYSSDFTDGVNYLRWSLVFLFPLVGLLQSIRIPGLTIICGAGHYKETQWRAILELSINLAVSIALTPFLGIAGVLIGMCASYLYRTTDVILYTAKYFLPGTLKTTVLRLVRNTVAGGLSLSLGLKLIPLYTDSWITWFLSAIIFGCACSITILTVNLIFEPKAFGELLNRLKELVSKKISTANKE